AFARDAELVAAGHTTQLEVRFVRRDGTTLWAQIGSRPILDRNGRADGALAMVMDVTKRKEAELARTVSEEASKAAEASRELVERSHATLEAQLHQAQKME